MDQHPENEVQTPQQPTEPESSYRYSRPAGDSFTDASYIPHDQAPRTPRVHSYVEPELRENTDGQFIRCFYPKKEERRSAEHQKITVDNRP